jgi:hypothetical protein
MPAKPSLGWTKFQRLDTAMHLDTQWLAPSHSGVGLPIQAAAQVVVIVIICTTATGLPDCPKAERLLFTEDHPEDA